MRDTLKYSRTEHSTSTVKITGSSSSPRSTCSRRSKRYPQKRAVAPRETFRISPHPYQRETPLSSRTGNVKAVSTGELWGCPCPDFSPSKAPRYATLLLPAPHQHLSAATSPQGQPSPGPEGPHRNGEKGGQREGWGTNGSPHSGQGAGTAPAPLAAASPQAQARPRGGRTLAAAAASPHLWGAGGAPAPSPRSGPCVPPSPPARSPPWRPQGPQGRAAPPRPRAAP